MVELGYVLYSAYVDSLVNNENSPTNITDFPDWEDLPQSERDAYNAAADGLIARLEEAD